MRSTQGESQPRRTTRRPLKWWKRIVFSLIPVTTLFISVELILRAVGFRFAPAAIEHPIFELDSGGVTVQTTKMFTENKPYGFPFCYDQQFAREKPRGIRIAMVGGSSVFRLGEAPLLAKRLDKHFHQDIEIINAAFQGCGSERVLLAVQEVVEYSPDFVVIYTGHNEFVSFANPATQVDGDGEPLKTTPNIDLRVVQLLTQLRIRLAPPSPRALSGMSRFYTLAEKEEFYQRFENRLEKIIEVARGRGAQVVLGAISYNYAVPPTNAEKFHHIDQLRDLSDSELQQQRQIHPHDAFVEYAMGLRAQQRGDHDASKRWFDQAFLHDRRPYRANTTINTIIRKVARRHNVALADVNAAVASEHPHTTPDFTFFSDHCHLNERGNDILQNTVAEAIINTFEHDESDRNTSVRP